MKALILAAGRGKRLGELTLNKNKCMMEINGRPLIASSLDCASKLDISEIIIVVGYQAEDIKNYCKDKWGEKPIRYVKQSEQKGLVHAIECAKSALNKEDFILMLGDELMTNPNHAEMINQFKSEKLSVSCGTVQVSDLSLISKTYGIKASMDGTVAYLKEKPSIDDIKKSGFIMQDIMGTGNCIFKNEIFSYIPKTVINNNRGEKELPDLIKAVIDGKKKVKHFIVCKNYCNVNDQEEINQAKSLFIHFSES